jgi:putative ABC transport system permease protein
LVPDRTDGRDAVRARFDNVIHDVRAGLRHVRAAPWFSLFVIGMLAAGIGANAAIFSAVNSLFLRPLPFSDSDRLVDLDETAPRWHLARVGVSGPDLYDWRTRNRTFDSMAFFRFQGYNVVDHDTAQRVQGALVTRAMLDVLRLAPTIGRNFRPDEDAPGGPNVVLLTDALWQRLFGRDPDILGRALKLDEVPYTVIGVLPPEAVFPDGAELWTPLAADPIKNTGYYVNGIGRLGPDVSIEQGQADLLRVHKNAIS